MLRQVKKQREICRALQGCLASLAGEEREPGDGFGQEGRRRRTAKEEGVQRMWVRVEIDKSLFQD